MSPRVLNAPTDVFAIPDVDIYRENGRLALGGPFVFAPDWTGRIRGFTFASPEVCDAAAADVIALVKAARSALAEGGRP